MLIISHVIIVCVLCCRAGPADREGVAVRAGSRAGPDGIPAAQVLHPAVSIWTDGRTVTDRQPGEHSAHPADSDTIHHYGYY